MWIEAHCFFKLGHGGAPGRHTAASHPRGAGSGLGSLAGDEETRPSVPGGWGEAEPPTTVLESGPADRVGTLGSQGGLRSLQSISDSQPPGRPPALGGGQRWAVDNASFLLLSFTAGYFLQLNDLSKVTQHVRGMWAQNSGLGGPCRPCTRRTGCPNSRQRVRGPSQE